MSHAKNLFGPLPSPLDSLAGGKEDAASNYAPFVRRRRGVKVQSSRWWKLPMEACGGAPRAKPAGRTGGAGRVN